MDRFTCSLIYDALALNTGALYGNIYINMFLSGALEIPACILPIWMIDSRYLGRRRTVSLSLLAAGFVAFLCIPLILLSKFIPRRNYVFVFGVGQLYAYGNWCK